MSSEITRKKQKEAAAMAITDVKQLSEDETMNMIKTYLGGEQYAADFAAAKKREDEIQRLQ